MAKFPEYFPENCPPANALSVELLAYRLSKIPINQNGKDWIPYNNLNEQKITGKLMIQAYGLSFYTDYTDCDNLRKLPHLKKKSIVKGYITPEYGVVLKTPSNNSGESHHTIWVYKDKCLCNIFDKVGDNNEQ